MESFNYVDSPSEIVSIFLEFTDCVTGLQKRVSDLYEYSSKLATYGKVCRLLGQNKTIGLICYYDNNHIDKIGYLSLIWIKAEYRRQKYGQMMLDYCVTQMKASNMEKLKLEVDKDNTKALQFYKSNGFVFDSNASMESIYLIKKLL